MISRRHQHVQQLERLIDIHPPVSHPKGLTEYAHYANVKNTEPIASKSDREHVNLHSQELSKPTAEIVGEESLLPC